MNVRLCLPGISSHYCLTNNHFFTRSCVLSMLVTLMTPFTLVVTWLFWRCCHGCLPWRDITCTLNPQMQPAAATVAGISTLHTTTLTGCVVQCLQHSDCKIAVHVRH